MPELYIIAGPNGAGKTTAAKTILPEVLNCSVFLNADEIARKLCPENVESVAFQAGRIMLEQIKEHLTKKATFGIETTLATLSYLRLVSLAREQNYRVILLFFALTSAELAKQRVALRVSRGGHNIPNEVIERRFVLGLRNMYKFINKVDEWTFYLNTTAPAEKIAEGEKYGQIKIYNLALWEKMKKL